MKVSIITPTLNRRKYLEDCINSVLWQDYKDIEYIVIDGLSDDGTIELLDDYKEKFALVGKQYRYISEKDNGLYYAMNKGIKLSHGDIVGILNSDDFFNAEDCITKVVNCFKDNNIDAVYADSYYVRENNIFKPIRCYNNRYFSPKWLLYGYIPDHETFYMKKTCYEISGYINTDERLGGDAEFIIRMVYVNKIKTMYLDKVLLTNRVGGVSTRGGVKLYYERIKTMMNIYKSYGIKTYIYRQILRYIFRVWNKIYIPKRFNDSAERTKQWFMIIKR